MRRFLTRRPAPGTVLGLVAVFIALGGVAFAQGTTTPGTTTTTTPAGPPPVAEALHALNADRANEAPIAHVTYVTERSELEDDDDTKLHVHCPSGMKVLGGGLVSTGTGSASDIDLQVSGASDEDSWLVTLDPSTNDIGETVRVTAICATVRATTSRNEGQG